MENEDTLAQERELRQKLQDYLNKVLDEYRELEQENRRLKREVTVLQQPISTVILPGD